LDSIRSALYPLVIIDVVKGCSGQEYERPEWKLHFHNIRQMLPRLNRFAHAYRAMGGKIIWVKSTPWIEQNLPEHINRLYHENPRATFYATNHVEDYAKFPSDIEVLSGDVILEKNNYSAFTNPELGDLLDNGSYLIAGVYADGCVNATIIDGWGRGYFPYILSDLVESMDAPIKQSQKQFLLHHGWPLMYGHVVTSTAYLQRASVGI